MRRVARSIVEQLATRTGLGAAARFWHRHEVAIVAYHNVVAPEEAGRGDTSLHLPFDRFIRQIDRLARTHQIVDLRTLHVSMDAVRMGRNPHGAPAMDSRPRAVITFDDAYRGAVSLALPELSKRGLPAVVFVSPGLLGCQTPWWDVMGATGRLTEQTRSQALHDLAGSDRAIREAFMSDVKPPELPESYGIVEADELMGQVGDGISVGSHAWDHEHLPSLNEAALDRTLGRSLQWVEELGDLACRWLALPFGAGSPSVARRAIHLGYEGVLRISGGLWRPAGTADLVPRINVPAGLSPAGLEIRVSGLR